MPRKKINKVQLYLITDIIEKLIDRQNSPILQDSKSFLDVLMAKARHIKIETIQEIKKKLS